MPKIKNIYAREILDSRGNPTVEATVELSNGVVSASSAPSGSSKGTYEATELRDHDQKRYGGMGVLSAIENVNKISAHILGMDAFEQQKIDSAMIELDGTQNKQSLGANAILAVSQAVVKAAAKSSVLPTFLYLGQFIKGNLVKKIPTPLFNLIEGGAHGGRTLNFQEFLLIPASSKSYQEALLLGTNVYQTLKGILFEKGENILVAEEGGFSPSLQSNQAGLLLLKESIEKSGNSFSLDAFLGLDVAANSFLDEKTYKLIDRAASYNSNDLAEFYQNLLTEFALIYIEDPFAESDWEGWKNLYSSIGNKILIVGDDLVTTNPYRLQMALDNQAVGGIIVKPNQIGTITEAIAVAEIARYKGLKIIVSHRSGETADDFIADFAVGISADYVKLGAPARERTSKYNRLLAIEEELKKI